MVKMPQKCLRQKYLWQIYLMAEAPRTIPRTGEQVRSLRLPGSRQSTDGHVLLVTSCNKLEPANKKQPPCRAELAKWSEMGAKD